MTIFLKQEKILLDGCSFTYGLNLDATERLDHLFVETGGFELTNLSRPGKSNYAIALDVYKKFYDYDIIIVGWTFSSRWHLNYHNQNIDFLPSSTAIEIPNDVDDSNSIERTYSKLHTELYSFFDIQHWNSMSDMLIDNTYSLLKSYNKKVIFYSFESRNTTSPLYYPHILSEDRLPCNHLNKNGTRKLFNNLLYKLEKE